MTCKEWEDALDECAFLKYCGDLYYCSGHDRKTGRFEFTNVKDHADKIYTSYKDALSDNGLSAEY